VVLVHGLFWSGLLSASGAYMTATLPESRRAEGLGYWGLASVSAIAVAPPLGFWMYTRGWTMMCLEIAALNLLMAAIAWRLPDDREEAAALPPRPRTLRGLIEWRVLVLSITMALLAFGYGSLTSFSSMFADQLHVSPRSVFLTAMAGAILTGRLFVGRFLDRIGPRRALLPCITTTALGMLVLAFAQGTITFLAAAIVFGAGFGLVYPAYTAYIMKRIPHFRRGAAFGAMLAAFDTGVGSGSTVMGWLVDQVGFRGAFGIAAALAALALPYFLLVERRYGFK